MRYKYYMLGLLVLTNKNNKATHELVISIERIISSCYY